MHRAPLPAAAGITPCVEIECKAHLHVFKHVVELVQGVGLSRHRTRSYPTVILSKQSCIRTASRSKIMDAPSTWSFSALHSSRSKAGDWDAFHRVPRRAAAAREAAWPPCSCCPRHARESLVLASWAEQARLWHQNYR